MDLSSEDLDAIRRDTAKETPPQQSSAHRGGAVTVAGALSVGLSACGGGGGSGSSGTGSGGGSPPVAAIRKPQSDAEAARFLLQASLSASLGTITELRSEGYEPWLSRQIGSSNGGTGRGFLTDRGFDRVDANRYYDGTATGDYMIWSQLLTGDNPVRKRIAFALSEFFVVSLSGIDLTWRGPAITEYWDISIAIPSATFVTCCRISRSILRWACSSTPGATAPPILARDVCRTRTMRAKSCSFSRSALWS